MQASRVVYEQTISIEVVVGGFLLSYTELTSGQAIREVHVSQRKLLNRVKEIVADSSLVSESKED